MLILINRLVSLSLYKFTFSIRFIIILNFIIMFSFHVFCNANRVTLLSCFNYYLTYLSLSVHQLNHHSTLPITHLRHSNLQFLLTPCVVCYVLLLCTVVKTITSLTTQHHEQIPSTTNQSSPLKYHYQPTPSQPISFKYLNTYHRLG